MAMTYSVWNGSYASQTGTFTVPMLKQAATAATAIAKTMLQIVPAQNIRIIEWGASFDGSSAATPVPCELIDTGTVAATLGAALGTTDVYPMTNPSDPAQTSGSTGVPLNLGTALSAYSTSASGTSNTEGTITAVRLGDLQQVAPTNQYLHQWPLSREFGVVAGHVLRIRMMPGAAVNASCYIVFEMY